MATNIGIMDSAYFVGRSEILAWINSTLQLNLSKVEEVLAVIILDNCLFLSLSFPAFDFFTCLLKANGRFYTLTQNLIYLWINEFPGLFRCGPLPAHGCGSSRDRTDAQGQFRCQERVRDDSKLQSPSRRF